MFCNACGATINNQTVILRKGEQTKIKHYNRVCKYAIEKGKLCVNDCRIIDDRLGWESIKF